MMTPPSGWGPALYALITIILAPIISYLVERWHDKQIQKREQDAASKATETKDVTATEELRKKTISNNESIDKQGFSIDHWAEGDSPKSSP